MKWGQCSRFSFQSQIEAGRSSILFNDPPKFVGRGALTAGDFRPSGGKIRASRWFFQRFPRISRGLSVASAVPITKIN